MLPPSCKYLCTVLLDHLPILFTSSMSAVAWYSAVAPPILKECDRNRLWGKSNSLRCPLQQQLDLRSSSGSAPEDHLKSGDFLPSWLAMVESHSATSVLILSKASTGQRNLLLQSTSMSSTLQRPVDPLWSCGIVMSPHSPFATSVAISPSLENLEGRIL